MIIDTSTHQLQVASEADPFVDMMIELNRFAGDAQKAWQSALKENQGNTNVIFKDWCLLALNLVAGRMQNNQDRLEALQELVKNFQSSYSLPQPQEEEEQEEEYKDGEVKSSSSGEKSQKSKDLREIQKTHEEIVDCIPELLCKYLTQKMTLDDQVMTTDTKIRKSVEQFNLLQKQAIEFQENLFKDGLAKQEADPFMKMIKEFTECKGAQNPYEQNLDKESQSFIAKQKTIKDSLTQALSVLSDEEGVPKVALQTRDLLIFESSAGEKKVSSFRFQSLDNAIQSFTINCSDSYGINGFIVNLSNGHKSGTLGKESNKKGPMIKELHIPDGLKNIRVRIYSRLNIGSLQLTTESKESELAQAHTCGEWVEFNLQKNETIVGIYGESYDGYNHWFRRLGFVIGKPL